MVPLNADHTKEYSSNKGSMLLRLSFGSVAYEWTMMNDKVVKQADGISCGPLACYHILQIFGYELEPTNAALKDYPAIRKTVMEHWNSMMGRNKSVMYVQYHKHRFEKEQQGIMMAESDEQQCRKEEETNAVEDTTTVVDTEVVNNIAVIHAEADNETIMNNDDERASAMLKRNARQEQLANKAMKQHAAGVKSKGASSGAIVTLKVDYRVHSHASGLMGVVYKALESGGILVACEHGIITSSGSSKDFWVPNDQYKVVALAHERAAITEELQKVRDEIIQGTYNYAEQPRISYAKYHDIIIQSTSPTKRGRCSCKKGCKKGTCGCLKKGLTCHSGCSCNGNCQIEK